MPETKTKIQQRSDLPTFNFASASAVEVYAKLRTSSQGLSEQEASGRLLKFGHNEVNKKRRVFWLWDFLSRFANPLVVLLLTIGVLSVFFADKVSAAMIFIMAFMSVTLSFIQEHKAQKAADNLNALVRVTVEVYRDGKIKEKPVRDLVPGDAVSLAAGDLIPADLRLVASKEIYVSQATLTGESFPVEKSADPDPQGRTTIAQSQNLVFMGSSILNGTGLGVVIGTGAATEFGKMSSKLLQADTETSFELGIKRFTWLMIRAIVAMVIIILAINLIDHRNFFEAVFFALAVAVGLTPETLPMIVTVNLSKGALDMSRRKVIVKRLDSIQNFGAMDVLCTDKTGTLTLDQVVLEEYTDLSGKEDRGVFHFGYINSYYQTGLKNLLDQAVLKREHEELHNLKKIDEIPFDFTRKLMSVVVDNNGQRLLIAKGSPEAVFARCSTCEDGGKVINLSPEVLAKVKQPYEKFSSEGFRVLAVAYKNIDNNQSVFAPADEQGLILKGYMAFLDPPKATARQTLDRLEAMGISLKVLTGDNELVTKKVCGDIGLNVQGLLTGDQVEPMSDEELSRAVETTTVFARLLPLQKERIIKLLHAADHTVGYLGDGINDSLALKAADVGISVNNAVDVAKASADIILLKKSLVVLADGVAEGRKVFGNITKYIRMSSSSNFGNMLSMTGASLILPFLPMAPIQILLNNFLYDVSQIGLPTDEVDEEYLQKPRPWNINLIEKFMLTMGPVSSLFDYATFGMLWFVFKAYTNVPFFQTGWFLESLLSQTVVVYIIRTHKLPFVQSRPSKFLVATSLFVLTIGFLLPYTSLAAALGLVHPPLLFFAGLSAIIVLYLILAQLVKQWFVKRFGYE